jgi:hypothetical protein
VRILCVMADASAVGWFPVLTLLLGYFTKYLSDWFQHQRTVERDRENRVAIRRDRLLERRTRFQRQTLLDLQEALMDLGRTTGAMHQHDEIAYRKSGDWQRRAYYPEDLSENDRIAMRRTAVLAVRVRDASVRELVQEFKDSASAVGMSASKEASDSAFYRMMPVFEELNQRIGEVLRKMDDEDS